MILQSVTKLWQSIHDARAKLGHDPDEIFSFLYLHTDKKVNRSLDKQRGSYYAAKLTSIAAINSLHLYVDPKNQKLFRSNKPIHRMLVDSNKPEDISDWLESYPVNKELLFHILKNTQ